MTDMPIIFSAPMVQALIGGHKAQTRRVLKAPRDKDGCRVDIGSAPDARLVIGSDGRQYVQFEHPMGGPLTAILAPYAIGDRLWVRETWGVGISDHGDCPRYKATLDYQCGDKIKSPHEGPFKWRSPMCMPRRFSRLTLYIADVRVQRLHEISEVDARQEGAASRNGVYKSPDWSMNWGEIGKYSRHLGRALEQHDIALGSPRWAFASYWNDIHGAEAWYENPWVCALTFSVKRGNIDDCRCKSVDQQPSCETLP